MAVGERTGEHQRLGLEGRELGRWRVHHALTKFPTLEELYPGVYPREIVRGEGIYLYDAAGRPLIDCSQHLGACAIGHGRREMAESMEAQASTLELCPLDGGFTSAPMLKLAAKLREIAPIEDAACYFTSTGSEASEQAIKLARWCQALRGEPQRVKNRCSCRLLSRCRIRRHHPNRQSTCPRAIRTASARRLASNKTRTGSMRVL